MGLKCGVWAAVRWGGRGTEEQLRRACAPPIHHSPWLPGLGSLLAPPSCRPMPTPFLAPRMRAGEISRLQAEALRAAIPRAALPGLQVRQSAAAQQAASRAHLEASLSTALALQSPGEYRRWLLAYAAFLAEQADAARLSEVCTALLGGPGGAAGAGDVNMAEASGSGAAVGGNSSGGGSVWQPTVLGLQKRELLREVLKEMSRNRGLQRTTQTYLDALTELERAAAAAAAAAAAQPAAAQLAAA